LHRNLHAESLELRLAEVRDLLGDRLRGQPTRAAFRTGDLTMCTLVPMRSVPHRVVCLVGLDDGSFPRGGGRDGDDLLLRARHVGDHDRRAEDRQLLLDAVLAATDALVITYAGRDVRTNEVAPPAVPVTELLEVIDATVRAADGRPARDLVRRDHPLHPSDRRCFDAGALHTVGPWSFDRLQLAGALAAVAPRVIVPGFFEGRLPAPVTGTGADPSVVLLEELVSFVQHPVKAFLRQRLGLSLWVDDDGPNDSLPIEVDGLGSWSIGDRLLSALLTGSDLDAACAAEFARGLLPPGALGQNVLDKARDKAAAIAAEAARVASGPRRSLEVDVALPDGRRVVGTVPDQIGDVVRFTTFSTIKPKVRIASWVRFLAAAASHRERALSSATVGWGRGAPEVARLPVLGATSDDRHARAVATLATIVDLRDRGLCEPLPLYTDTSQRYAVRARRGRPTALDDAAGTWTSTWTWAKEDKDPEHLLVLSGQRPFAEIAALRPAADESGPGWVADEDTRFGRLARRLWDPLLEAMDEVPAR